MMPTMAICSRSSFGWSVRRDVACRAAAMGFRSGRAMAWVMAQRLNTIGTGELP